MTSRFPRSLSSVVRQLWEPQFPWQKLLDSSSAANIHTQALQAAMTSVDLCHSPWAACPPQRRGAPTLASARPLAQAGLDESLQYAARAAGLARCQT